MHLLTIWRFSAHGERFSHDFKTLMVSLRDERTTKVRKASVLVHGETIAEFQDDVKSLRPTREVLKLEIVPGAGH
ncbi:hypothetical protein MLD38_008065 [Melastoma candidum]|uniref:Uncharacterized protein n=1 Tax=Melastoma candidum TaxID=119954 RepID=A0ACB9S1M7_9MYRT|nr:hypothetical protein MLD38_008065 [Melastoma candidum]